MDFIFADHNLLDGNPEGLSGGVPGRLNCSLGWVVIADGTERDKRDDRPGMNLIFRELFLPPRHQTANPPKAKPGWLILAGVLALLALAGTWWIGTSGKAVTAPPGKISTLQPLDASHAAPAKVNRVLPLASPAGGQPRADLAVKLYNFGHISAREPVVHDFFLLNQGSASLEVTRAYTTCACTSAHVSSAEIPPGEAAQITVQFDPRVHDVSGTTVRRGLILETNDPDNPQLEIWIQATVE